MKKKYGYLVLMSLLCGSGFVNAAIISDKQGITVKQEDVDNFLKPAPEKAQLEFLKTKDRLIGKLEQLYLTKAIAEQSKQVPLTAEEQAEFDKLMATYYFQRKIKQLTSENLPDFEPLAKLHFDSHKDKYINPEMVAVEHILIDFKKHKDNEVLKTVNDLIAQLKKGADFATLAEKYSDDPSVKINKGKLGLFGKGQMLKEFEDAAYALKLNEISKPVKTTYGYHVLRKYEQKASGPKTFAEVKDELVEKVKKDYIQNRLDEYYTKVKKDNEMSLDDKSIDAYIADKTKQLEAKLKPAVTPQASETSQAPAAK